MIQGMAMAMSNQTPEEMIRFIDDPNTSAFDLRRRYTSDKTFARFYDELAQTRLRERIALEEQPDLTLTPEIWHSLPFTEAMRRYKRDRRFKAAVDKLAADGKI